MRLKPLAGLVMLALAGATAVQAANHREAPITALDHKADITDVYAFVSYGPGQTPGTTPSKATLVLCVDPLLEPGNGPTWFPFDPEILYEIKVDNDNDAREDVTFQLRFSTSKANRISSSTAPGLRFRWTFSSAPPASSSLRT